MATVLGSLMLKITGDTADAHQAIDKVEKKAKGFSTFIKGAMGLGGAVIAFRALKNISKELIAVYSIQETAETKLRSAITATGKEGLISAQALYDYASQLQEVTTYGDEATISAMALLQQLGDLSEEGIKQLMPLMQDFASTGLVNLETAVSLVGKTLGSTTNALARYGIVIDATAPKEEKLAALVEAMQNKFGGLSKDLALTGTGALQQYQNAMGDLKEVLGKTVLDGIAPFVRGMTNVISDLVKSKQEAILTKKAYEELKSLGEGQVLAEDQQLLILKDQVNFLGQVTVSYMRLDEKAEAAYQAAVKRLAAYQDAIIAEKYWNDQAARAASEAAKKEAEEKASEAQRAKELIEWITKVNAAYAKTPEAKKEILDAEIAFYEFWSSDPRVKKHKEHIEAILELLYEQRDAHKETGKAIEESIPVFDDYGRVIEQAAINVDNLADMEDRATGAFRNLMQATKDQTDLQFDLAASFENLQKSGREWSDFLATTLVAGYGASFEAVGQAIIEGKAGWEALKEAGKETIASLLRAFGTEWAARAMAAFAIPLGLGAASGIKYLAASAAAFTGAGIVRALEHGGWINEPVIGRGLETGTTYAIAEKGPEYVSSPAAAAPASMFHVSIYFAGRHFYDEIHRASADGSLVIHPRSVRP